VINLLSNVAFKFNLRRYKAAAGAHLRAAGLRQGITLVLSSAQRKRFVWDKGCIERLYTGCVGGVKGY